MALSLAWSRASVQTKFSVGSRATLSLITVKGMEISESLAAKVITLSILFPVSAWSARVQTQIHSQRSTFKLMLNLFDRLN